MVKGFCLLSKDFGSLWYPWPLVQKQDRKRIYVCVWDISLINVDMFVWDTDANFSSRICIKWLGPVRQRSVKMMPNSRGSSDHNFNLMNLSFNINYLSRWKRQHWSLAYETCWLQTILGTFSANFEETYSYIKRFMEALILNIYLKK